MKKDFFAIYKNGQHKGNEMGFTSDDAIKMYVIESLLEEFLSDPEFMAQYTAIKAINGIHYNEF